MAFTRFQLYLAALLIVSSASSNLFIKWAHRHKVLVPSSGRLKLFDHPYIQVFWMFFGELLCLPLFYLVRLYHRERGSHMEGSSSKFNWLVFLPSTLMDMCSTSLLIISLNLTLSSGYQMFRGASVIFTGLLSVAFLGRYIRGYMWMGLLFILAGMMTCGLGTALFSDALKEFSDKNAIVAGDLLIVIAQAVVAGQMVYREKFILHHNIHPLKAVGIEGLLGVLIMTPLLYLMTRCTDAYPPFTTDPGGRIENIEDAIKEMRDNPTIIGAFVGNILSDICLSYSGVTLIKEQCATTSMVIGSYSTVIIWAVSVGLKWDTQDYRALLIQSVGFLGLIAGGFIYNNVVFAPCLKRHGCMSSEPEQPDPDAFVPRRDPTIGGPSVRNRGVEDEESAPLLSPASCID